jgi:hypothetical protein
VPGRQQSHVRQRRSRARARARLRRGLSMPASPRREPAQAPRRERGRPRAHRLRAQPCPRGRRLLCSCIRALRNRVNSPVISPCVRIFAIFDCRLRGACRRASNTTDATARACRGRSIVDSIGMTAKSRVSISLNVAAICTRKCAPFGHGVLSVRPGFRSVRAGDTPRR